MTNAVVTTSMVCLLPEQAPHDSYTLYNRGPATIFIDQYPSVNPVSSYGLIAGASIIWDPDAPLYAITKNGSATLTMFVNSGGVNNLDSLNTNIAILTPGIILAGADYSTDIYDCSAYKTLIITKNYLDGGGIGGDVTSWFVQWYDDDGNSIGLTEWDEFSQIGATTRQTIPVQGRYFRIAFNNNRALLPIRISQLRVIGSTIAYQMTNDPLGAPQTDEGVGLYSAQDMQEFEPGSGVRLTGPYYLRSAGRYLQVTFFSTGAVTGAGAFRVEAQYQNASAGLTTARLGTTVIPIGGANETTSAVFFVPIGPIIRIVYTDVTGGGAFQRLSAVWQDYQPIPR